MKGIQLVIRRTSAAGVAVAGAVAVAVAVAAIIAVAVAVVNTTFVAILVAVRAISTARIDTEGKTSCIQ